MVGLASLVVYLSTMAPGLTWAHDSSDGGELATAAQSLGIAHPPGYPAYVLLGHLFTRLPIGETATRTNLLSAVCAAGAAALVTWTLGRVRPGLSAAVGAGLALAFCPLLWSQAVVTEVHALNVLFAALLLWSAVVSRTVRPSAPLALAVGITWGLSLGNHPTALFCAPLVVLAAFRLRRLWPVVIAGVALGLLVYLLLPLRAAADPPVNWGDPRTAERFWWVVSGTPYRDYVLAVPGRFLVSRLAAWAAVLVRQFGGVGLLVTLLGGAVLWAGERGLAVATAATLLLGSAFAVGYDTSDSYLYLLPGLVCLAAWLARGIGWVVAWFAHRARWAGRAAMVLAVMLPLLAAAWRLPELDVSDDRHAADFIAIVLGNAPPEAVILSRQDRHTFALWYGQHALGMRPDVSVVDPGLLVYDWYRQRVDARLATALTAAGEAQWLQRAASAADRTICLVGSVWAGVVCAAPP